MRKIVFVILALLVLSVGANLYRQNRTATEEPSEEDLQSVTALAAEVQEANDSGITGWAEIRKDGEKSAVVLTLDGEDENQAYEAGIHGGSCAELGEMKYTLGEVSGGELEKGLEVNLQQVIAERPLAIEVRMSDERVACGDF